MMIPLLLCYCIVVIIIIFNIIIIIMYLDGVVVAMTVASAATALFIIDNYTTIIICHTQSDIIIFFITPTLPSSSRIGIILVLVTVYIVLAVIARGSFLSCLFDIDIDNEAGKANAITRFEYKVAD